MKEDMYLLAEAGLMVVAVARKSLLPFGFAVACKALLPSGFVVACKALLPFGFAVVCMLLLLVVATVPPEDTDDAAVDKLELPQAVNKRHNKKSPIILHLFYSKFIQSEENIVANAIWQLVYEISDAYLHSDFGPLV